LVGATATAKIYGINGKEITQLRKTSKLDVSKSNIAEVFVLNFVAENGAEFSPFQFIKLTLTGAGGELLSQNLYWRNGKSELDYTALNSLPKASISCEIINKTTEKEKGKIEVKIKNNSETVAFGNRLRL